MALVLLALAALPAVTAGVVAPPQPTPRQVVEAVRVNVVNVEVWVTARDGRPVYDLRPEEFELREDGVVVPLSNFLAPVPPAGTAIAAEPTAPPAAPAVSPPPPEEQQRTLVVFVDDLNLSRVTRNPVLDRLPPFVDEQLRAGYRVVVLDFDLTLRQLTPLTSERSVVAAGLGTLGKVATEGAMVGAQRDRMLADTTRGTVLDSKESGDLARRALLDDARSSGQEQAYRQEALLRSLERVVDSLAGMPGRKALLYVSDGIPTDPGADVLAEAGAQFGVAVDASDGVESQGIRSRLKNVARHANAGRITFYTINVPPPGGTITAERGGIPADAVNPDVLDAFNRDFSLNQFTSATGGRRFFNPDALREMATDLQTPYSLGYSPNHYGDGVYHHIKVKVGRPGVSVRYREGYLDKTPEERQADVTGAALFAGGNSNPLAARIEVGVAQKQGRGKVLVPLTLFVPAQSLLLLENRGMREGRVTVTIAAAKAGGRRSEIVRRTFPISVPEQHVAGFLQHDVSFEFSLLIEEGKATISVMASDDTAHLESVVVTNVAATPSQR